MIELSKPLNRELFLTEVIDKESIGKISQKIIEINNDDLLLTKKYGVNDLVYTPKPIQLYIDSPGGAVYSCLGLVNLIETSKTPVHTIVLGGAMSAGFLIAISGHKRYAYEHSTFMIHQVSSAAWGTLKYQEESIEETKRLQNLIETIIVKKTKIQTSKLSEIYNMKLDWFMTSEEAKKLNIIDEIIGL